MNNLLPFVPKEATPYRAGASAPRGGVVAPPVLIGGVKSQKAVRLGWINSCNLRGFDTSTKVFNSVGVDWLAGTIPFDRVESCKRYFELLLESEPECLLYGQYRYDRQFVFHPYNIRIYFDSSSTRANSSHGGRALVVFTGQALQSFDVATLHKVFRDMVDLFWMKATRIDLCFDDYARRITPHEVFDIAKRGFVSGFQKVDAHQPQKINGELLGDSVCFGTRGENGSGKYLRFYDKFLESKGEIDCCRWEVEFSKEKGAGVFFALSRTNDLNDFAAMIGVFIGGCIDFVVRKDKNLDRAARLDWWAEIVEILGRCKLRGSTPVKVVEKSAAWVGSSVAPSLRMLFKAYGNNDFWSWMEQITSDARPMSDRHYKTVVEYWRRRGVPKSECPF